MAPKKLHTHTLPKLISSLTCVCMCAYTCLCVCVHVCACVPACRKLTNGETSCADTIEQEQRHLFDHQFSLAANPDPPMWHPELPAWLKEHGTERCTTVWVSRAIKTQRRKKPKMCQATLKKIMMEVFIKISDK